MLVDDLVGTVFSGLSPLVVEDVADEGEQISPADARASTNPARTSVSKATRVHHRRHRPGTHHNRDHSGGRSRLTRPQQETFMRALIVTGTSTEIG
ncbi:hypothetical protein ACTMTI_54235 [Nonomuraea sp. H19]|uniref:hypothetical protein n=1 Tax=Nonomuraea sp. H19 TaxID=3452206 RepID=UPI003F8C646C